jgi:hypothetical protein
MSAGRLLVASATLVFLCGVHAAHAHGIAGNRFFPGTLTFDDPAVADEARSSHSTRRSNIPRQLATATSSMTRSTGRSFDC